MCLTVCACGSTEWRWVHKLGGSLPFNVTRVARLSLSTPVGILRADQMVAVTGSATSLHIILYEAIAHSLRGCSTYFLEYLEHQAMRVVILFPFGDAQPSEHGVASVILYFHKLLLLIIMDTTFTIPYVIRVRAPLY